jgi:hypothetical protein
VNTRITLSSLLTLLAIFVVPYAPAPVQARQQPQAPTVQGTTTQPRAGFIEHLEITSISEAYGGASFGSVGPYQVISGLVHGEIQARHPANAGSSTKLRQYRRGGPIRDQPTRAWLPRSSVHLRSRTCSRWAR